MSKDDVTQIRVGNSSVGIMGLKTVLEEMSGGYADKPDKEVMEVLLNLLGERNYIPSKVKEDYGRAFLLEFRKFLGKPCEDTVPEGLEIKVLGPGCAQCDRLERELKNIMAETGMVADIEHVRISKRSENTASWEPRPWLSTGRLNPSAVCLLKQRLLHG